MALKPEDPSNGFQHDMVVAFINERMSRHEKGSAFYLGNIHLSWAEVEDKLQATLEDRQVPSEAKEACVWGSLALGVRFAHRQSQLHTRKVQWLQDFTELHKSAAEALVSDLKLLKAQQEVERKEAAFLLQLAHARLAEVQRERDLLKWKLAQAEPVAKGPGLATASGTGAEGAGEEEEEAGATAPAAAASGATEGGGRQKGVEGSEAAEGAEELRGDLMQLPGVGNQKKYTSDAPTPSPPTSSPPAAPFTAGAPSQRSPRWGPSDSSLRSDVGGQNRVLYKGPVPFRESQSEAPGSRETEKQRGVDPVTPDVQSGSPTTFHFLQLC
ncbi:testis-expressed protein 13B [Eubalaena glacialis]|uniref:testis-expressed protein 13B n=1 Tax=Eubalaena glacialis TaxID=27606 RepID=UPI002A5A7A15|nr:testis-expressed protein 13B [Eubalaena glacialis]